MALFYTTDLCFTSQMHGCQRFPGGEFLHTSQLSLASPHQPHSKHSSGNPFARRQTLSPAHTPSPSPSAVPLPGRAADVAHTAAGFCLSTSGTAGGPPCSAVRAGMCAVSPSTSSCPGTGSCSAAACLAQPLSPSLSPTRGVLPTLCFDGGPKALPNLCAGINRRRLSLQGAEQQHINGGTAQVPCESKFTF